MVAELGTKTFKDVVESDSSKSKLNIYEICIQICLNIIAVELCTSK